MSTFADRPNSAVLVIDVQVKVVAKAHARDAVVANIDAVVAKARAAGVPVIWVQHNSDELAQGSAGWQYVPELVRREDEALVHKRYGDSFEETDLESLLAERKVGRVVITGAQTDACIRSTLHGALVRGYDTTLVADAHTTEDLRQWGAPLAPEQAIAYTNMYWSWTNAPGRTGSTVPSADVEFTVTGGGVAPQSS